MTRKRWLIALGSVALALAIVLLAIDPSTEAEGNPGIVSWEFAWSEERTTEILADWGPDGQDAARLSLRLDFLYLLAYGAFFALACAATRDLASERGWSRMAAFGAVAVPLAIGAALFDAIENVFLLVALEGEGGEVAPHMGAIFAVLKFAALAAVQIYIVAGLVLRFRDSRRAKLNQRPSSSMPRRCASPPPSPPRTRPSPRIIIRLTLSPSVVRSLSWTAAWSAMAAVGVAQPPPAPPALAEAMRSSGSDRASPCTSPRRSSGCTISLRLSLTPSATTPPLNMPFCWEAAQIPNSSSPGSSNDSRCGRCLPSKSIGRIVVRQTRGASLAASSGPTRANPETSDEEIIKADWPAVVSERSEAERLERIEAEFSEGFEKLAAGRPGRLRVRLGSDRRPATRSTSRPARSAARSARRAWR